MVNLGKFISADWSTLNNKGFDVARFLVRITLWEAVNRLIKVRINGLLLTLLITF